MNRETALKLIRQHVSKKNLIKHMLATEAAMRELSIKLGGDPEKWAMAGLLHDLDYDKTENDFPRHALLTAEILSEYDIEPEIIYAIKAHPGHDCCLPKSPMDWALHAVDGLTGLVVSATLMHPDRKLKSVDSDFIMRRFNEKRFSANVNRDQIRQCSHLGLNIKEFVEITLRSMQSIDKELGL